MQVLSLGSRCCQLGWPERGGVSMVRIDDQTFPVCENTYTTYRAFVSHMNKLAEQHQLFIHGLIPFAFLKASRSPTRSTTRSSIATPVVPSTPTVLLGRNVGHCCVMISNQSVCVVLSIMLKKTVHKNSQKINVGATHQTRLFSSQTLHKHHWTSTQPTRAMQRRIMFANTACNL